MWGNPETSRPLLMITKATEGNSLSEKSLSSSRPVHSEEQQEKTKETETGIAPEALEREKHVTDYATSSRQVGATPRATRKIPKARSSQCRVGGIAKRRQNINQIICDSVLLRSYSYRYH